MAEFPQKNGKPEYHCSNLYNYFTCPKKFLLSATHSQEQTEAMRNGLLFEGYVFGFKKGDYETPEKNKAELEGKKKKATLDSLRERAEIVRDFFDIKNGASYVRIEFEGVEYRIAGEADFVGPVIYKGEVIPQAIGDLKFTGNIEKNWNYAENREDYLQAAVYPYILWKRTKKIYPFVYTIVEDNDFKVPLVKQIKITPTLEDFQWVEKIINRVHNDLIYRANPGPMNCIKQYNSRCPFLEFCAEGRAFIAEPWDIKLENLK